MSPNSFSFLLAAALELDRQALAAAGAGPGIPSAAWAIAFLGGLSLMLGQSVVLFANRVSRRRFLVCMLVASVIYVASLVIWASTIWIVARVAFRLDAPAATIALAVCVGQAPRIFGLLILLPYVGSSIHRVLDAYALVVVIAAVSAMLDVRIWTALGLVLAGWAFQAALDELLRRPLAGVRIWLWRASTGQATRIRRGEVAAVLSAHARRDTTPEGRSLAG